MLPSTSQLYSLWAVLYKFYDNATEESDGENLDLDPYRKSFDEVSVGEEVGDGYLHRK